jgi:hypothetical protein
MPVRMGAKCHGGNLMGVASAMQLWLGLWQRHVVHYTGRFSAPFSVFDPVNIGVFVRQPRVIDGPTLAFDWDGDRTPGLRTATDGV